jgi:alanyl-tRNA synthetase
MEELNKPLVNIYDDLNAVTDKANNLLEEYKAKGFKSNVVLSNDYDLSVTGYRYITQLRKKVSCVKEYLKNLTKEYNELNSKDALSGLSEFEQYIEGDKLVHVLEDYDSSLLKQLADALLNKMGKGVVFLANVSNGKVVFVCKQNSTYNAGALVKLAAVITGGNGGGKPDIAQAGGKDVSKLEEAILAVKKELC